MKQFEWKSDCGDYTVRTNKWDCIDLTGLDLSSGQERIELEPDVFTKLARAWLAHVAVQEEQEVRNGEGE